MPHNCLRPAEHRVPPHFPPARPLAAPRRGLRTARTRGRAPAHPAAAAPGPAPHARPGAAPFVPSRSPAARSVPLSSPRLGRGARGRRLGGLDQRLPPSRRCRRSAADAARGPGPSVSAEPRCQEGLRPVGSAPGGGRSILSPLGAWAGRGGGRAPGCPPPSEMLEGRR